MPRPISVLRNVSKSNMRTPRPIFTQSPRASLGRNRPTARESKGGTISESGYYGEELYPKPSCFGDMRFRRSSPFSLHDTHQRLMSPDDGLLLPVAEKLKSPSNFAVPKVLMIQTEMSCSWRYRMPRNQKDETMGTAVVQGAHVQALVEKSKTSYTIFRLTV